MLQKLSYLLIVITLFVACKNDTTQALDFTTINTSVDYAKGFSISHTNNYTIIKVTNPWPGADKAYTYAFAKNLDLIEDATMYDAVVEVPVKNMVVTSTTHIPSLEMLNEIETLVGFPNLDYISSEAARLKISEGSIKELGKNEALNTETLIDLSPDAVVSFAVEGEGQSLQVLKKTGIPVFINADWTETHPLGKAEWIKFFGVLYDKVKQADSIFNAISKDYLDAKKLAEGAAKSPTVLSGAMYKDVWYMPQGGSWAAQFITDANGTYLWNDQKGTGSIALNIESVLDKGQFAEVWIGPGQFNSKTQLLESNPVYGQFDAFKNNAVYTFTSKVGATGGVLYYELAPNRPDIVLKDIIKILHPELELEHEPFFFTAIK